MKENEENKETEKTDENKKSLLTVFLIIGIIIAVFIVSYFIAAYIKEQIQNKNNPATNIVVYNNYSFVLNSEKKWETQILIRDIPYVIPFYYNPQETESIPVDNTKTVAKVRRFQTLPDGKVYITVDPDEPSTIVIASVEIARILGKGYGIYNMDVSSALMHNASVETKYPIITCENQSNKVMVIQVYTGTENKIHSSEDNCIYIESATINESIKVADAFVYRLMGIVK